MNSFWLQSPEKRSLIISLIVYAIGIVVFIPFAFFDGWFYLLTGWVLGMVINLVNYLLIVRQGQLLKRAATTGKSAGFAPALYFLRFALYAAGLVLVGVLHDRGLNYFNIFTVAGAYLVIAAVIFMSSFFTKKGVGADK